MNNFFSSVILSDDEESKEPYTAHSLSPGMIFDGATSAASSRRNPPVASYRGLVVVPGGGDLAFSQV
jgi:hypothetical protein